MKIIIVELYAANLIATGQSRDDSRIFAIALFKYLYRNAFNFLLANHPDIRLLFKVLNRV